MDYEMLKDIAFSAVQGSRFEAARRYIDDPVTRPWLISLALVLEPLRILSSWFMRRAHDVELHHSCRHPLCGIVYPGSSPVVAALQYLASMLHGQPRRLVLLWRSSGYASFAAWFASASTEIRQLPRLVMAISASIYHRIFRAVNNFPWALVAFADPRTTREQLDILARRWDRSRACCLPAGMARKLKNRDIKKATI